MDEIVLASASIDRKKILERAKVHFKVLATQINEESFKTRISDPLELIKTLARLKAITAREMLKARGEEAIIIAADTIVYHEGNIIGKAGNEREAFEILKRLVGNDHTLMTGVAIADTKSLKIVIDHDETIVSFSPLSDDEILNYLKTGEWKGRAGAYSLREAASLFVETIKGSPSNVLGLPIQKVHAILKNEFGMNLIKSN